MTLLTHIPARRQGSGLARAPRPRRGESVYLCRAVRRGAFLMMPARLPRTVATAGSQLAADRQSYISLWQPLGGSQMHFSGLVYSARRAAGRRGMGSGPGAVAQAEGSVPSAGSPPLNPTFHGGNNVHPCQRRPAKQELANTLHNQITTPAFVRHRRGQ